MSSPVRWSRQLQRENAPRCWAVAQATGAGYQGKHQCSFRARYIFEDRSGQTRLHLCGTHKRQLERGGGHPGWRLVGRITRDGTARRIQ